MRLISKKDLEPIFNSGYPAKDSKLLVDAFYKVMNTYNKKHEFDIEELLETIQPILDKKCPGFLLRDSDKVNSILNIIPFLTNKAEGVNLYYYPDLENEDVSKEMYTLHMKSTKERSLILWENRFRTCLREDILELSDKYFSENTDLEN